MGTTVRIDGRRIRDLPTFYAEMNHVFMQGVEWQMGENLDALNDVLHGGFGTLAGVEVVRVEWIDLDSTRQALGVDTTRQWLQRKLDDPRFNRANAVAQLEALGNGTGRTYFDIVMEIFADHDIDVVPIDADPAASEASGR